MQSTAQPPDYDSILLSRLFACPDRLPAFCSSHMTGHFVEAQSPLHPSHVVPCGAVQRSAVRQFKLRRGFNILAGAPFILVPDTRFGSTHVFLALTDASPPQPNNRRAPSRVCGLCGQLLFSSIQNGLMPFPAPGPSRQLR